MIVGVKEHDILTYCMARSVQLFWAPFFGTKLGPSLRAGQYERIRRVDDEMTPQLA